MTRTMFPTAALAAALALTLALVLAPRAAQAQQPGDAGLRIEVRPSGPPGWLDPPNTPIPGNLERSQRRLVYEMMELGEPSAFTAAPERYQHHLLPRRRELGDIPPFLEFED